MLRTRCDETPHWPHRSHRQEITAPVPKTTTLSMAAAADGLGLALGLGLGSGNFLPVRSVRPVWCFVAPLRTNTVVDVETQNTRNRGRFCVTKRPTATFILHSASLWTDTTKLYLIPTLQCI